ncbi:MAG: leucine-rich repeat domain-containing protein, partial [Bacillota bacterium]|nr:leucine-rich repeat domain-containing protein [Bacillota bacterium]
MRAIKSLKLTIPLTVFMAAVFLLLFAFTQSSYAISRSGNCGDNMSWELDDDGLLTISGSGEMDDYSTYGKVPWNTYKSKIKMVVISDGVTSIGDYAFYQCVNMKEIAIPDSMTRIGDRAFGTCRNLGNLVIPGKVTSIGDSCFYDCDGLTNVAIPGSV